MTRLIASKVISYVLGSYIEALDSSKLELSIFGGDVAFKNLKLKSHALASNGVPVNIKNGIIQSLSAKFPWLHLGTQAVAASVKGLYILGTIDGSVLLENDMKTPTRTRSELDSLCEKENLEKKDVMTGIVGTVIDNLIIDIQDIHIRLEFKIQDKIISAGIVIPSIQVFTIDDNGNKAFISQKPKILRKKVFIQNLSVYLDTNTNPIDNQKFLSEITAQSKGNHQYILKDFTFDTIWEHNNEKSLISDNFIADIPIIDIALDRLQWYAIDQLSWQQYMFNKQRLYRGCGRPDRPARSERSAGLWWYFANNAAKVKKHPQLLDTQAALTFLKNRKQTSKFLEDYMVSTNRTAVKAEYTKLEEKFGLNVMYNMMTYSRYRIDKSKSRPISNELDISSQELRSLSSQGRNKTAGISANLIIHKIQATLNTFPGQPLVQLLVDKISCIVNMTSPILSAKASITGIGVVDIFNDSPRNLVQLIPKLDSPCMSLDFTNNSEKRQTNVKAQISSPEIIGDVPKLVFISNFFKTPKKGIYVDPADPPPKRRDSSKSEILELFEKHPFNFVDLEIDTPHIVIPFSSPIHINLDSIKVHVDPSLKREYQNKDTWYDRALLDIRNFSITFNERKVVLPFSTSVGLNLLYIPMSSIPNQIFNIDIAAIEVNFTRNQYLDVINLIKELTAPPPPLPLLDEDKKDQKQPPSRQKIIKSENGPSMLLNVNFKSLILRLFNQNDKQINEFTIGTINSCLSFIEDSIDCKFSLINVLALDIEKTTFFSFGGDHSNAIEINISKKPQENITDMTISLAEPYFLLDFTWVFMLSDFFKVPKSNKIEVVEEKTLNFLDDEKPKIERKIVIVDKKAKSDTDNKLRGTFIVKNPNVCLSIPSKKSDKIIVQLFIDRIVLDLDVQKDLQKIKVTLDDVKMMINQQNLILPFTPVVDMNFTNEKKNISVNLHDIFVNFDTQNYYFILDMLDYTLKRLNHALAITKSDNYVKSDIKSDITEKPQENIVPMIINVDVDDVKLDMIHLEKKILAFNLANLNVGILQTGIVVNINSILGKEFLSNLETDDFLEIQKFNLNLAKPMTIKFDSIYLSGKTAPLSWAIGFFTQKPPSLINSDDGLIEENQNHEQIQVENNENNENDTGFNLILDINSLNVPLVCKDGSTVCKLITDLLELNLKIEKESGLSLQVDMTNIKIDTDKYGPQNQHFLYVDENQKVTFKLAQKYYGFSSEKLNICYNMQFLNDLLSWSSGLTADLPKGEWKDSPMMIPTSSYDVCFDTLNLRLVPYEIEEDFPGVDLVFNNFSLKTPNFPTDLLLKTDKIQITDKSGYGFLTLNNLDVPIFLDLRNEPQPIKPGFDEKIREEFIGKSDGFFYGIKVTPTIESIEYDMNSKSTLELCHSLSTFTAAPPPQEKPETEEKHETAFVGLYTTVLANLKKISLIPNDGEKFGLIQLNNLNFGMEDGNIGIDFDEFLVEKNEMKIIDICEFNEFKKGVSFKLQKSDMFVTLGNLFLYLDYKFVAQFYKYIKVFPFLTYDFFPNKQVKSEVKTEEKSENNNSQIKADVMNMCVTLPIDPEKSEIMVLDLSLSFEKTSETMMALLHHLNISMGPKFGEKLYNPIVILQNIKYFQEITKENKNKTSIETQTVRVSISPIDIASIIVLQNSIMNLTSLFIEKSPISYEKPEKVEEKDNSGQILSIFTGSCWIDICSENRLRLKPMPLLRITTEPIDVEIDMSKDFINNFTLKSITVEHYDHKTHKFSKILEPTTFNYFIEFSEKTSKIKIRAVRDMNINITHKELSDLLKLLERINYCVSNKKISTDKLEQFKLYNNLGIFSKFEVGDRQIELSPLSVYISSYDVNPETPISLFYGNKQFQFTTSELNYPRFLTNNIIASYSETPTESHLLFSTPIKFHNNTRVSLLLYIHSKRNKLERALEIQPDEYCNLPCDVSPTCNMGLGLLGTVKPKYDYFSIKKLKQGNFIYKVKSKSQTSKFLISSTLDYEISVLNVEISPQVVLRNNLMHQITIQIAVEKDKEFETLELKENEEKFCTLSISNLSKLLLKLRVAENPFSKLVELPPQTKKSAIELFILENTSKIKIVADTEYDDETQAFKITFFSPTVIFNKSGFDLMLCDSSANIAAEFAPLNDDDKPSENGYCYWGTSEYFESNFSTLSAYLLLKDEWLLNKTPLQCLAAPMSEDYFIALNTSPHLFVPLHYTTEIINQTSVVTIQPYIAVENLTKFDFRLDPIESFENPTVLTTILDPIIVRKKEKIILPYSSQKLTFIYRSLNPDGSVWSSDGSLISLESPVHTTFMDNSKSMTKRNGIELEIKGDGKEFLASFKDAKVTQPLTITNYNDIPVYYKQVNCDQKIEVLPQRSTFIMLQKPFELNDIIVCIYDLEINVNLTDIEHSIKYIAKALKDDSSEYEEKEVWIHIEINDKCRKTIAVSNRPVEQPTRHCWNFSLIFDNINISLIDKMGELCVLNIHGIQLKYVQNDRFTNVSFCINSMQLDDMLVPRNYGVVLAAYPDENHHWFEARCTMFGDAPLFTAFSFISIRVQKIIMSVDLSFVSDIWNFVKPLLPSEIKDRQIKYSEKRTVSLTSSDFTAQSLKIHEVQLNFSIFSSTARVGLHPLLTEIINFVPSVSGGSIVLPELPISDFTATGDFINERIVQPYIKQVTSQALKLLFNTNMLFAIHEVTSNISRQSSKLAKGDIKAIGGATVGTVLAAGAGVTRTIANVFHTVSGQESYGNTMNSMGAGDSINHGLGSIYKNVSGNSFNVVQSAMSGAEEDGAIGAVVGFGKGIGNMVMSPLAGILDASTSILSGATKFVNDDDLVYKSIRIPRCFSSGCVEEFQKIPAMLQLMIFEGGFPKERIEILVKDISAKDERYIAITSTLVFVIRIDVTQELQPMKICDSKSAFDGQKVVVSFKNLKGVLKFIAKNEDTAKEVSSFLTSRHNELNIGEDMELH
ncbi:hypothetical protein TVAG_415400 [Trichomonas vaginalis G3]|uniref:Chorein N-terminal domain-containing protein n=1 Tax=Trichomonas vaginalis (strain ATCC PRA-98 / G3) TaxID=412133 RepID=A2EW70_TRIV3|nr:regulation of parkin-mediated stimulation of mitophagy in response to mitochondrial depolarization [Trichomonas vaginalis G3]EAY03106.1 hypothetical protein TVAG_415400 [Trichomonas vaginalis G3]KAI5513705.1 regulation of parkin-mediated stimulation of mitophagy in response to mitochondrial depolarization [Trichomonas vaginalis G3]|eukprot:XP_001315329.1 hypothetical protein [Trichomonas vaginalis G3]